MFLGILTRILVIAAVIAFVVGLYLIFEKPKYGVLCFLFVGFIAFGIYKANESPVEYIHTSTEYIAALQDNNITNSRYYMRRGRINEDLWYQYMVKSGCGYKANKCKSKNAIIYCNDDETPRVEWYDVEQKWLFFRVIGDQHKKIYIPNGSIVEDYTIDLE